MYKNKDKNKAFTFAELSIAFIIMSFLAALTVVSGTGIARKFDIMKLKNANLTFKTALNNIMTNPLYYSKEDGLLDVSLYETELTLEKRQKFFELIGNELNLDKSGEGSLDCCFMYANASNGQKIYCSDANTDTDTNTNTGTGTTTENKPNPDKCYKGENGLVWYIPYTCFGKCDIEKYACEYTCEKNGNDPSCITECNKKKEKCEYTNVFEGGLNCNNDPVIETESVSGSYTKYAPITIYPDEKHISTEFDFKKYALVIGLRSDGDTIIINSVDCSNDEYKDYNQCKYVEYLGNVKNTQGK